jgi:lysophospholipase L1-like esterase
VGADRHGHLGAILTLDGWELETIAENGRTVSWAIGEIEDRDARVPRNVVVALGSNPGFSSDGFAEDVQAMRDLLVRLGARRIVWLAPYHTDPERYAEKIAILTAADRADRRLVVPNWAEVLDANPEWVRSDGIHLTEDGYSAMAVFIRDWL